MKIEVVVRFFMEHLDHVRRVLITEPRGYPCQNLNIILPPCHPEAAAGKHLVELLYQKMAQITRLYKIFS